MTFLAYKQTKNNNSNVHDLTDLVEGSDSDGHFDTILVVHVFSPNGTADRHQPDRLISLTENTGLCRVTCTRKRSVVSMTDSKCLMGLILAKYIGLKDNIHQERTGATDYFKMSALIMGRNILLAMWQSKKQGWFQIHHHEL